MPVDTEFDLTYEQWAAWFQLWQVAPWTDGAQLVLRPGANVPESYRPALREAKAAIIAGIIEERDDLHAQLLEMNEPLRDYEKREEFAHPDYCTMLAEFGRVLNRYQELCLMAPEPREVAV